MSDLYETASESTATMSPRLQVGYRNRRRIVCEPHIILPTSSCSFCASTSPPPNPTQRDEAGGRSLQRRRASDLTPREPPAVPPSLSRLIESSGSLVSFFFLPTFLPRGSSKSVAFKRWCGHRHILDPLGGGECGCDSIYVSAFDFAGPRVIVWHLDWSLLQSLNYVGISCDFLSLSELNHQHTLLE
jgi:hypothetical protein